MTAIYAPTRGASTANRRANPSRPRWDEESASPPLILFRQDLTHRLGDHSRELIAERALLRLHPFEPTREVVQPGVLAIGPRAQGSQIVAIATNLLEDVAGHDLLALDLLFEGGDAAFQEIDFGHTAAYQDVTARTMFGSVPARGAGEPNPDKGLQDRAITHAGELADSVATGDDRAGEPLSRSAAVR